MPEVRTMYITETDYMIGERGALASQIITRLKKCNISHPVKKPGGQWSYSIAAEINALVKILKLRETVVSIFQLLTIQPEPFNQ